MKSLSCLIVVFYTTCAISATVEKVSLSNELWTGAVALVGTADGVVLKRTWGWIDKEKRFPIHENVIFDIASVTKAVGTTTALALCVDRGLIDLDTVFTNYLPLFTGTLKGPVTVRDLARHISGFNNSKSYAVQGQVTQKILNFSPVLPAGPTYEYSCGNFILLGLIVEKVTGRKLDDFCRENVFEQLGMRNTYWMSVPNPDPENVVRHSTLGVVSDEPARSAGVPIGNAGLFSTVEDLAVFCRMILAGGVSGKQRILSEQAIRLLETCPDKRSPVTFGWRVNSEFNPSLLSEATMSHTGWTGNSVWIDPLQQRYVIILTNRSGDHGKATRARTQLANCLLHEIGQNKEQASPPRGVTRKNDEVTLLKERE